MKKGLKEECGIFGFYNNDDYDSSKMVYYGLLALQHRGQESCGIAVNDKGTIIYHKNLGLVSEVFNEIVLNHLKGNMAVGHVRYSTTGNNTRENAQPLVLKYINGSLSLVHNGNLINALEIRNELEKEGSIFQTTIDSEVIAYLLAKECISSSSVEKAIEEVMKKIIGSYSLIIMESEKLIAVRDPWGIRPLCIGKNDNSYVIASESVALDTINAEFIRDVLPGEIITIDKNGIKSIKTKKEKNSNLCIFEYIYFARPDSIIDGISVYEARKETGKILSFEHPVEADLVIGVPDSGISSAIGYSEASGIPYGEGLIKNRYVGRTFIEPNQSQREESLMIKLNVIKHNIRDKRIVLIDDSIVRGNTIKRIISILKSAGVKEIHLRISSPPFKYPCYFGTDIPSKKELIADKFNSKELCKKFKVDSLEYISLEGIMKITKRNKCILCNGCFSGKYPIEVTEEADKTVFEKVK